MMENSNTINSNIFKNYKYITKIKIHYLVILFGILIILFLISISKGEFNINIYKILSRKLDEKEFYILYNIRLLRAFANVFIGGGLGFCGALLQILLKNPMASPYTLGISQGAAFGASVVIIFAGGGFLSSTGEGVVLAGYNVVIGAFLGSISATTIMFFISLIKSFSIYTIILAGISTGALFSSLTMFVQYISDDIKAAATLFWTFGDISKAKWSMIYLLSFFLIPSLIYFTIKGWCLNLFGFGRDFLRNAGISYKRIMILGFLSVSLIVAIITSFVGIIGFIGLLSPHISRFFSKGDSRFFILYSFVIGGIILLISDLISRFIFYPSVIPVGIITSFFGVCVLLYIIFKNYDRN